MRRTPLVLAALSLSAACSPALAGMSAAVSAPPARVIMFNHVHRQPAPDAGVSQPPRLFSNSGWNRNNPNAYLGGAGLYGYPVAIDQPAAAPAAAS